MIKGAAKEVEKGVTQYEVESVDGKLNRDLLYAADGKVLEIEETTAPENLPAPVKQTLAKDYAGAKVLKAEILTKAGVKTYELSIELKGKNMEPGDRRPGEDRQVSADGTDRTSGPVGSVRKIGRIPRPRRPGRVGLTAGGAKHYHHQGSPGAIKTCSETSACRR